MKTRIAVGAGLLLTLGSALAGTLIYGQVQPDQEPAALPASASAATANVDLWAAATDADYVSLKVPI